MSRGESYGSWFMVQDSRFKLQSRKECRNYKNIRINNVSHDEGIGSVKC